MVERARLEIVLRGNTYGGSNPSLCATKKGSFIRGLFLWQKNSNQRGIRGKEARAGASGLQAHIIYKLQKGKVSIVSNLIINTTINFVQPAGSILLFDFFYAYVIMII